MAKKKDALDIAAQQRAKEAAEVEALFLKGVNTLRDLIAPSSLEFQVDHFRLGTKYGRTLYVYGYPREIYTGWLSNVINRPCKVTKFARRASSASSVSTTFGKSKGLTRTSELKLRRM